MAQFTLVAYYLLGAPYSMQLGANVRMDLLYAPAGNRQAAWDIFTVFCLMFYLGVMLWGRWTAPPIAQHRRARAKRVAPALWPIRLIITLSFALMILQAIAHPDPDIAIIRGVDHPDALLRRGRQMSYEWIATLMFSTMLLMMITGQRVFGAIGFVAVVARAGALGAGRHRHGLSAVMKLMKWNALLTLPMFVFMGYVCVGIPGWPIFTACSMSVRSLAGRACHRDDPADGADLGDERAFGGGHGHRRHHRAAGTGQAPL